MAGTDRVAAAVQIAGHAARRVGTSRVALGHRRATGFPQAGRSTPRSPWARSSAAGSGGRDAGAYWVVQLVGAALAGWLVRWVILPVHDTAKTLSGHGMGAAFVAELVFTFALVYVVLTAEPVAPAHGGPNIVRAS